MTEIERVDLWELFVGTQNIKGHFRIRGDYIIFRVHTPGDAGTTATTLRHSVKISDLEDIEEIFNDVSWSSVPSADYLLWILWVREERFDMRSPLKKNDQLSFAKRAFSLIKQNIGNKTIGEVCDFLLRGDYFQKDSIDYPTPSTEYFLTTKGKRIAKRMFKKTTNGTFAYDISLSIASGAVVNTPPHTMQAASGRGNPKSAVEAYQEAIEWADEPAEVIVKNIEPLAVKDNRIIELLEKLNSLVEKNTAVNRKGFESLKPVNHQSLAELVKTLPPLPDYAKENENWVSSKTAAAITGLGAGYLGNLRRYSEKSPDPDNGVFYGQDKDGRIWFKVAESKREKTSGKKIFYLKTSL